jgi:hypothetical protein
MAGIPGLMPVRFDTLLENVTAAAIGAIVNAALQREINPRVAECPGAAVAAHIGLLDFYALRC